MNKEQLHIYHTNDLHSHFEHWPRIRAFLLERKQVHQSGGEDVLLFDIGDHVDRWHPLTDATRGKHNITLMNEIGYDAVTIGNNEGITLSHEELDTLYQDRKFDVIVANFFKKETGQRPKWVDPYRIYETKSGVRVGVLGLTAYFVHFYGLLGWSLTEPLEELALQIGEVQKKADVIILLSHLGIHEDEMIAEQFPEIDVILGAHTHHVFHEGKETNGVLQSAAGKYGMFVGHVELTIDIDSKRVVKKSAKSYDSNTLPEVSGEAEMVDAWQAEGRRMMSGIVANVPEFFRTRQALARLLCDTLASWCRVESAFINEGMILHDFVDEEVTEYQLLTTCPHPINPCVVQLSGAELLEVIRQAVDPKWESLEIKGFGFRGTLMGRMIFTGITFEATDAGMVDVHVNGQPLDRADRYAIAIPDMFTFGRLFPEIRRAEHKTFFFPEFMRDLLRMRLQELS